MRTTIRLPDELYDQVRQASRAADSTVTAFIERALQRALLDVSDEPREPFRMDVFHGDGLMPGVDLDDNSALLDLMDADARP